MKVIFLLNLFYDFIVFSFFSWVRIRYSDHFILILANQTRLSVECLHVFKKRGWFFNFWNFFILLINKIQGKSIFHQLNFKHRQRLWFYSALIVLVTATICIFSFQGFFLFRRLILTNLLFWWFAFKNYLLPCFILIIW